MMKKQKMIEKNLEGKTSKDIEQNKTNYCRTSSDINEKQKEISTHTLFRPSNGCTLWLILHSAFLNKFQNTFPTLVRKYI